MRERERKKTQHSFSSAIYTSSNLCDWLSYSPILTNSLISMESAIFSFLKSCTPHNTNPSLIISILLILIFILNLIITKLKNKWCTCETCQTYIQSRWKLNYPNLCDWYTHLLRSSPTATIHIHVLNNTITANPDNVEYMLKTRFDNFPKGKPFSVILGDFLGKGIFNADGELWRFQRNLASLELTRLSIRSFAFEIVNHEIASRLMPLLESVSGKTDVLDLQDVFRRFSFDCICKFSFGLDPKCLEASLPLSEFAVAFDLASRLSAERAMTSSPLLWKIKRLFNIGSEKELRRAIRAVNVLALEVIRQKRKLGISNPQKDDLLSRFMNCTNGVSVDEGFLQDIVVNFLLAGRDTVASGLTGFFRLLARHPEAEARILHEADEVIGPGRGPDCYGRMRDLHYLHAAVHESMRLYPPVQFDSKFCLDDDFLPDGSFVKKGSRVTYHPYAMGRSEEIWGSDCLEFRPERWLRDGVFCQVNPFKYPVFQAGLRVCLGKEMAIEEMKCVAVSLLREYHVELVGFQGPARFSPGLTATYRDGLRVLIRRRNVDDGLSRKTK